MLKKMPAGKFAILDVFVGPTCSACYPSAISADAGVKHKDQSSLELSGCVLCVHCQQLFCLLVTVTISS